MCATPRHFADVLTDFFVVAVEYIALVKEYNADLAQDSTVLRNHLCV